MTAERKTMFRLDCPGGGPTTPCPFETQDGLALYRHMKAEHKSGDYYWSHARILQWFREQAGLQRVPNGTKWALPIYMQGEKP